MNNLKFAVIGAGNGGTAFAADLALQGYKVSIYDKYVEQLEPIIKKKGLELVGSERSGFAAINHISTNLKETINEADIIIISTTTTAHIEVAKSLAPIVSKGQIVTLSPGHFGGALIFKNEFERIGVSGVDILELRILPYAGRMLGPGIIGIKGRKVIVHGATLPASRGQQVFEKVSHVFPWLRLMSNVLEVGINNTNPILHVPITLLSLAALEVVGQKEHFRFDDWHCEPTMRLWDQVDKERLSIVDAFGFNRITTSDFVNKLNYDKPKVQYERVGEIPETSKSVPPRYIIEDVPMGLVPISELGKQFGIQTPLCDALIEVTSIAKGINFKEEGRTLRKLGVEGLSPDEMIKFVE